MVPRVPPALAALTHRRLLSRWSAVASTHPPSTRDDRDNLTDTRDDRDDLADTRDDRDDLPGTRDIRDDLPGTRDDRDKHSSTRDIRDGKSPTRTVMSTSPGPALFPLAPPRRLRTITPL